MEKYQEGAIRKVTKRKYSQKDGTMGEKKLQLLSQAIATGVATPEQGAKQLCHLPGKDSGAVLAGPCRSEYVHGC